MSRFLKRLFHALFGRQGDPGSHADPPRTEAEELRQKIRKWRLQAEEYETMGLTELARRSRESLVGYRRRLMALENPPSRRSA